MATGARLNMTAGLVFLAITVLSAALLAGFFGALHPAFDSFSHFRIHFSVLMALVALPLLASSYRLQAAAA
ncbi:MAG: AP endonuclease, partial [Mesorhizobium sp.]